MNKNNKFMNFKKAVNFIFEINQLKRQCHSGFQLVGVKDPYSVAEHVMRAAQIGYIIAVMEGDANPEKVASMILIHDNGEARIGDQHKVAARYFDNQQAEGKAFADQLKNLGGEMALLHKYYLKARSACDLSNSRYRVAVRHSQSCHLV